METYWQRIEHIIGPARAEEFDQIGQKATRVAIEQFVLDHSDKATSLLDAGCNTGVEGYRLFHKSFPGKYSGVDSNPKAIKLAMENLKGKRAEFFCEDLSATGLDDRSFDIVLTKDVIEHAQSYQSILGELCRVSHCWLILSMFIRLHDKADLINLEPDGFHHNRYQRSGLYDFMAAQGFSSPEIIFSEAEEEVLVFKRLKTD